jgi:hypothetical protein
MVGAAGRELSLALGVEHEKDARFSSTRFDAIAFLKKL